MILEKRTVGGWLVRHGKHKKLRLHAGHKMKEVRWSRPLLPSCVLYVGVLDIRLFVWALKQFFVIICYWRIALCLAKTIFTHLCATLCDGSFCCDCTFAIHAVFGQFSINIAFRGSSYCKKPHEGSLLFPRLRLTCSLLCFCKVWFRRKAWLLLG